MGLKRVLPGPFYKAFCFITSPSNSEANHWAVQPLLWSSRCHQLDVPYPCHPGITCWDVLNKYWATSKWLQQGSKIWTKLHLRITANAQKTKSLATLTYLASYMMYAFWMIPPARQTRLSSFMPENNTQKKSDIFKSATSISPIILKNRLETKETRETISNNALHKTAFGQCFVGPILPVLSESWRLVDDACACLWMVRWSNESNGPGVATKWMNLCGNIAICQDLPGSFQGLDKNKQNGSKKNWHLNLSLPKISS